MTPVQAFEMAIELAISAPSQSKSDQAVKLAEEIAMQLTKIEIDLVKSKFEMGEYE
jgi:hypothetical protein